MKTQPTSSAFSRKSSGAAVAAKGSETEQPKGTDSQGKHGVYPSFEEERPKISCTDDPQESYGQKNCSTS